MAVKPNYYETLYVVRPDIKEEELAKIQQKLDESIAAHEGEIIKSDKWAQRELAYEIKKYTRGVYYIIIFKALPGAMAEIERHLRFYNSDVLRFMTVKISENAAKREKPAAPESKDQEEPAEAPAPAQAEGEN
jgi:small subunit ribosomal protein S6